MQAPITLASGSTTDPFLVNPDGWVLIEAGSSTVTLQYTTGTTTDIAAGTAAWVTAGSYTGFTAVRADEELADTWVKLTASGGSATYHVEGELSKADRLTVRGYKKSGINNFGATYSTDASGNVTGLVGPGGGVIPVNGLRTTPVRVATFGDSTANAGGLQGSGGAAGLQDLTQMIPDAWNSGQKFYGVGLNRFAADLYYPQIYLVADGGIAGQTTTQMVSRETLAYSTTQKRVQDILDLNPQVVILRGGSINDLLTVTAGTLASTVSTTYANHVTILNRFMSAGVFIIDEGIAGFSNGVNTATDLASTRSAIAQLNALYAAYAAQYPSNIRFLDPVVVGLSDTSGAFVSAATSEGTHPNVYGQMLIGKAEASLISTLFGVSSNIRYPGPNVVSNAMMANATGGVATGYTVATSVATLANQKVEVISGKVFQTAEWTLGSGTNTATINVPFNPTTMSIVSGDVYGFEYDMYFAGLNGYVPDQTKLSITPQVRFINTVGAGDIIQVKSYGVVQNYGPLSNGLIGHIAFNPIKVGDVSANFTTGSRFQLVVTTTETSGAFKMGIGNPRIVKLGQAVTTT